MSNKGKILILSSPSGGGKTTICRMVLKNIPDTVYSVSATTREKRAGEKDGVDYFFLNEEDFERKEREGYFAETALVHGKRYGTPVEFLNKMIDQGKIVVMDIDVQGALKIMEKYPNSISIFIMPPSFDELEKRLKKRKRDGNDEIKLRIENAKREIYCAKKFKYIVVNENLDTAFYKIREIIEEYKKEDR